MVQLKGITWDHVRGYGGLSAVTRIIEKKLSDIHVQWDVHSLADFSAKSIADVAKEYDLIVYDHPFVGDVWADNVLVDLTPYLDPENIQELKNDVVGNGVNLYRYKGGLWGLPLDAACQVAVYRPDLCTDIGVDENALKKSTLDKIIEHVRSSGKQIAIAYSGVSSIMTFFTLCYKMGHPPFQSSNILVPDSVGEKAIAVMKIILDASPSEVLDWDTITCLENMSARKDLVYCPYIFGFSAYSTDTYISKYQYQPLVFIDNPLPSNWSCAGGIIGGAGIGVSRNCIDIQSAVSVAQELMKFDIQKPMALNMSQPSRHSVWIDYEVNKFTRNFYSNTIQSIENGYLRPRDPGFVPKQDEAGRCIECHLRKATANVKIMRDLKDILLTDRQE